MNIKPLDNRVVVQLIEKEETTASGIVLPGNAGEKKKQEAMVMAIGPGTLLESGERAPMQVAVGDKVLIRSWGGDDIKLEGTEYKIISQDDVLAVFA